MTTTSSFSGEFLDPVLEARYRLSVRAQTARYLRNAMLVLGLLVLVLTLVDLHFMGMTREFYVLLSVRLMVGTACLSLGGLLARFPGLAEHPLPVNLVCAMLAISNSVVVFVRPETVEAQFAGIVTITMVLYLFIPNRLQWALAHSVVMTAGFLVSVRLVLGTPPLRMLMVALVMTLPGLVGHMTAARLNRLKREQYVALLASHSANALLQSEIAERQRLEQELRHLAQTDHLTGLHNRRWFLELATQELRRARRSNEPLTLFMLDLDYFKAINDEHGHVAGDQVLIAVAALCRRELRDMDIIGRFGGEEFIIALPNTDTAGAKAIAERLRDKLEQLRLPGELTGLRLTATSGIAQVLPGEDTLEPALLRADKALYQGKHEGRNRVMIAA